MSPTAERMKIEYQAGLSRLLKSYHSTPSEKRGFSPSPTARTPKEIVLHCAMTADAFTNLLNGHSLPFTDYRQIEPAMRSQELEMVKTADEEKMLNEKSEAYYSWLEQAKESDFDSTVKLLGMEMPAKVVCEILTEHTVNHAAQIDYVQTIYGDRDWHQFD
jgi:hypothetical protein